MTDKELLRYKDKLLNTFGKFIEICEKNNLQYYCAGGTIIGAVRHNGFIPWDDDIDVFMPREDYEKFKNIGNQYDGYKAIFITNCDRLAVFGKFYDTNTTLWEFEQIPFVYGIYVDIFPLDETTDDVNGFLKKYKRLRTLQRKYLLSQYNPSLSNIWQSLKKRNKVQFFKNIASLLFPKFLIPRYRKSIIDFEAQLSKSPQGLNYASYFGDYWHREFLKREWFDEYIEVPFENLNVRLFGGYKEYLTQIYGDYMKLPPVEKQVSHHYHYFLDMDKGLSIKEVKALLNK